MNSESKNKPRYLVHIVYLMIISILVYFIWNDYQVSQMNQTNQKATCLRDASNDYNSNWANACRAEAIQIRNSLRNCENEAAAYTKYMSSATAMTLHATQQLQNLKIAQCKSAYDTPNSRPNCVLPNSMAKNIDNAYDKEKSMCKQS